jgi:hypothetical protein
MSDSPCREVDRVDGKPVRDLPDDELEVVELRTHRVHQEQGWAAADAQVADARAAAQHDVAALPAFASRLGVDVGSLVLVSHAGQLAEIVCRGHVIASRTARRRGRCGGVEIAATQEAMISGVTGPLAATQRRRARPHHLIYAAERSVTGRRRSQGSVRTGGVHAPPR